MRTETGLNPIDSPRPALLFVHGAWHGAWCWDTLRSVLSARGWSTHAVDLPSASGTKPGPGLEVDAQAVRHALQAIDGSVAVVAHSYGGMPVTQAAADDPDVVHLVYLAAFMLDAGQSVLAAVGGHVPPWWDVRDGTVTVRQPHQVFFADVPARDADNATSRLRKHSLRAFTDELTTASWKSIPTTYIVCEQDQAIPPAAQVAMSASATAVLRLPGGHSPYLSRPSELATVVTTTIQARNRPQASQD